MLVHNGHLGIPFKRALPCWATKRRCGRCRWLQPYHGPYSKPALGSAMRERNQSWLSIYNQAARTARLLRSSYLQDHTAPPWELRQAPNYPSEAFDEKAIKDIISHPLVPRRCQRFSDKGNVSLQRVSDKGNVSLQTQTKRTQRPPLVFRRSPFEHCKISRL